MLVIRVVSELFFSSKITEACRTLQIETAAAKSAERLDQLLEQNPDAIVFVDLGLTGEMGPELAGRAVAKLGTDSVLAFYSHVATGLLKQAEAKGVTRVMPRSQFFEDLPNILQSLPLKAADS